MIKSMTAELKLANQTFSVTYWYIVLWTGDEYEVTVFEQEPVESPTYEFIARKVFENDTHVAAFVQRQLTDYIMLLARGAVTFE